MKTYTVPIVVTDLYWLHIEAENRADATRKAVSMGGDEIEEQGKVKDRRIETLVQEVEEL